MSHDQKSFAAAVLAGADWVMEAVLGADFNQRQLGFQSIFQALSAIVVSSMGSGKGLAGVTCKTLSVWLAQRRRSQEDIIVHECTPRFQVALLRKYLDMYDWMELPLPGERISPHQLGCLL